MILGHAAGDIRAVLGKADPEDVTKVVGVPVSNDHNAMSLKEQEKLVRDHPGESNVFRCRHPDSCYVKGALQPTRYGIFFLPLSFCRLLLLMIGFFFFLFVFLSLCLFLPPVHWVISH